MMVLTMKQDGKNYVGRHQAMRAFYFCRLSHAGDHHCQSGQAGCNRSSEAYMGAEPAEVPEHHR